MELEVSGPYPFEPTILSYTEPDTLIQYFHNLDPL